MDQERRKGPRRRADEALRRTVRAIQALDRLARGVSLDFGEYYADLVGMRYALGRREEDRKLAEGLCTALESLASSIRGLLGKEGRLRKVRVTKVRGKKDSGLEARLAVEGWEEARPKVGSTYRVFRDDGGVFRSGTVIKVAKDLFQTRNSVYKIEVLEES